MDAWMDGWMNTHPKPHSRRCFRFPTGPGPERGLRRWASAGRPLAAARSAAGAVCAENSACSQGRKEPGAAAPHRLAFAKQPPVPRKSPTRTRSWASGNGARSARLKERFTEHVRCACAEYTQREGALPVAWPAPPALLPAPVCGRAERGPPLP